MNETNLVVEKSTCEQYTLRWRKGYCWAIFTIDEGSASFGVQSDYGNYNYRWPHHGSESLKHFLVSIGDDYFMNKVSGGKEEFDAEATIRQIKQDIICLRKTEREITADVARECWDEAESIETDCENGSKDYFFCRMQDSKIAKEIYYYDLCSIPCCTDYNSDLKGFMLHIMPEFKRILRDELEKK